MDLAIVRGRIVLLPVTSDRCMQSMCRHVERGEESLDVVCQVVAKLMNCSRRVVSSISGHRLLNHIEAEVSPDALGSEKPDNRGEDFSVLCVLDLGHSPDTGLDGVPLTIGEG